jgi:hypothetical protein
MGAAALRNVKTCGIGVMADGAVRGVHALSAAQHGNAAVQKFQQGDYVGGSVDLVAGAAHAIKVMLRACFARGTHLLTPDGSKAIEELRVGDVILSRDENDPNGPVLGGDRPFGHTGAGDVAFWLPSPLETDPCTFIFRHACPSRVRIRDQRPISQPLVLFR